MSEVEFKEHSEQLYADEIRRSVGARSAISTGGYIRRLSCTTDESKELEKVKVSKGAAFGPVLEMGDLNLPESAFQPSRLRINHWTRTLELVRSLNPAEMVDEGATDPMKAIEEIERALKA